MNTLLWILCSAAVAAPASTSSAPEFLLADLAVRVDLPGGWRMVKWSDWDFAGATNDGTVQVMAWATEMQVPITDPAPWAEAYTSKIEEMKATVVQVKQTRLEEVDGRKYAFVDVVLEFAGGKGQTGTLYGATTEIAGKDFHLATISHSRFSKASENGRSTLVRRLDHRAELAPSTFGSEVIAKGVTTTLPPDWRPPLDSEFASISPMLADLGLVDVTGCWTAIRPQAMAKADVMASCPRPMHLGVVDEYSFDTAELVVRNALFGPKVSPAPPVKLSDRLGFLYVPRDGLAMGAVPSEHGVIVTWALGKGDLGASVTAAMQGSVYSGAHPIETNDTLNYWLSERTFSPQVLCPIGCCLGSVALLVLPIGGVLAMRSRRKPAEEDDA